MSFNVTGMTDYIKQEGFGLIVKSVTEGKTASLVNVISNLKGEAEVPFLSSAITLKAGGSCGAFNGAGSTSTFSKVNLGVKPVLFEEALCIPALQNKVLMYETTGSDALPYAEAMMAEKVALISKGLDALTWAGDTGAGDPFNGFLVQGSALLQTVTGSTSGVMEACDAAIDAAVAYDSTFQTSSTVAIFLSYANFRALQKELVAANYFHYAAEAVGTNMELTFPGTSVRVIATEGLSASSNLYLADTAHLHIGTNLASEAEGIVAFYDMPSNSIMLRSEFFYGTGVSKEIFEKAI